MCPDVVTVLSEIILGAHQPFGHGSYKELEIQRDLHKLTNGIVREHLLICVGFQFYAILKGLSVIMAGLKSFHGQKGSIRPAHNFVAQGCWLNQFLIR